MKFQLKAVFCCAPEKCLTPREPQPSPPPPRPPPVYHSGRRGSRRNQPSRRVSRSKYLPQSQWQPSLGTISEDNTSLEVSRKIEGQLGSQMKLKKASNSPASKAKVSTYAREIRQASTFHMAIPAFVPSAFLF